MKESEILKTLVVKKKCYLQISYIPSNSIMNFDLYVWVSYKEGIDQSDMLSSYIKANLVIEGLDSKNSNSCK